MRCFSLRSFIFCIINSKLFILGLFFLFLCYKFFTQGGESILEYLIEQAKLTSTDTTYKDPNVRDAFYQSQAWRKKRRHILERDNYECQVTKDEGGVCQDKLIVHHIKPLEYFPSLAMDDGNLVVVTQPKHNIIHGLSVAKFNDEWW